ncbi:hypothetical protein VitviT2T_020455 [Vitis vinifera]|uniref:Protein EARLY RESPONSIVE TO DEHYDRATION 15 n=2 Tax=Vitis vinifera TaxID=29760 RepID=A0ABY9D4F8_VITVI|eukprot:XP_002268033.1 PREDICTED: protein EARLY RESPONSIVE TO DEHYDRATION 15 isoform X2 [Vitis vinifera]
MALVSGGRSTLNPNAPLFIPAAFRQVEDFSPEWWKLVKTSTWFRDYWLSQHQDDENFEVNDGADDDVLNLLPETFDLGIDEESLDLEVQMEELIQLSETKEGTESASTVSKTGRKPVNGLKLETEALMKNLNLGNSPKGKSPKTPVGPAKYHEKAAQCMSPKYGPRRINQPR